MKQMSVQNPITCHVCSISKNSFFDQHGSHVLLLLFLVLLKVDEFVQENLSIDHTRFVCVIVIISHLPVRGSTLVVVSDEMEVRCSDTASTGNSTATVWY